MMKISNIFFDFDGVIAESVNAKTEAFRKMYLKHGQEIADQVVKFHIENGGVSRYDKFRHWEKTFFDRNLSETEVNAMAKRFSDLVLDEVIAAKEVRGVKEFLEKYHSQYNFWIITGTPTQEIEIIVKKRNLSKYFKGVHGSPKNKKHWSEYLIKTERLDREKTLFIGDATTDMEAAEFSQLHFALRMHDENQNIFEDYRGLKFHDFFELEKELLNLEMISL
ncbi:MAG: hypothetical protein CMH48_05695 [Muricauda sp.]|nr:hypothetical protein [Allomuricauda sp.]